MGKSHPPLRVFETLRAQNKRRGNEAIYIPMCLYKMRKQILFYKIGGFPINKINNTYKLLK
jgi:hypothetical protein